MKFGRPHRGGGGVRIGRGRGSGKSRKMRTGGSKKVVFVRTSFMDAPKALFGPIRVLYGN